MKLTLLRDGMHRQYTAGKLYINNVFECHTMEDVVRAGAKVPGQTAIPAGTYEIIFTKSGRFGDDWPLLVTVPNFTAIRIHGGNTPEDTEGCILVGRDAVGGYVTGSQAALKPLLAKLRAARDAGEKIEIEIVNGQAPLV